jgi:hypothetical protein
MRPKALVASLAIVLLASVCSPSRAQSVAEAARETKEKKQKKQADATQQPAAKPKVITNDEIPEASSGSTSSGNTSSGATGSGGATTSGSQSSVSKPGGATGAQSPGTKTPPVADSSALPHGPDSAHVEFKFTSGSLKRPAKAETQWMMKNTSDHTEHITLKTIVTGPCGYHDEYQTTSDYTSGTALSDNFDGQLTVLSYNCTGTYRLELQAIVGGKVLDSASDTVTYE